MLQFLFEIITFSFIMVIFGFLVSYITDLLSKSKIIWLPKHSFAMASGTFFTSSIVYILFSNKYINYKCNNKKIQI